MPRPNNKNVRRAAVSALRAWSKGHDYADTLVSRHAERNQLSQSDRNLLNAILLGVLRNRTLIDHVIGKVRKGKLDHETRDVLRVGVCQILILELPDHAAVHETVECARAPVRGLINAVLRQVAHFRARTMREIPDMDPPLRFSHPQWLFKHWKKEFGLKQTMLLMHWNNQPAEAHHLDNPFKPEEKYITDPSTSHAPRLLAPQPGETVLDACAAPGGKTFQMAISMENKGQIIATDSNPKRIPRLQENIDRLGIANAEIKVHDWTQPARSEWIGKFDRILLDVPCSNTGVLRRRVDARWRLQRPDLDQLTKLQRQITENALPCLKPGGHLVYSTCSIDPLENTKQIKDLLKDHPELTLIKEKQLLPFKDRCDGAFAALIQKRA